eukprot:1322075-Amphidinium_carterae.1
MGFAFKVIVANGQDSKRCNRPVGERSRKTICCRVQYAHGLHHMEPALWECSLEAVMVDSAGRHCSHPLEAAPWEGSLQAVFANREVRDCPHRSDAAHWNCSFEA